MIRLDPVSADQKDLLWNVNQKYLYEMTKYYPDDMDGNGNYTYGYFDEYFTDPLRRAFFISDDSIKVGFLMINPYSYVDAAPDYVMAEFTVFPSYRKRGYAKEAVKLVFSTFRGKWEIKYNENNVGAKALWTSVTAKYDPKVHRLSDNETVLEFTVD